MKSVQGAILLVTWTALVGAASAAEPVELPAGARVVVIGNTFADQLRLRGYVETLLTGRWAEARPTFRNLGWSADTLTVRPRPLNFGSLDEHLSRQKADVIIACFGMNEAFDGPEGLDRFEKDYRALVKHLRGQKYNGKSPPRLVIVSPIRHEPLGAPFPDPTAHNENLRAYTKRMSKVAAENRIPFIDLFAATTALLEETRAQQLTSNGIHLNSYGYWAVAHAVTDALAPAVAPWSVELDAEAGKVGEVSGAAVEGLTKEGKGWRFTVSDKHLLTPLPPTRSIPHPSLLARQPLLRVKGLPLGEYALRVEGKEVVRASHDAWAEGVRLSGLPGHGRAEALREAINVKNAAFFHYWRAHNSEYIFGRRTKPFGAVSFPPEMAKWQELIEEKDQAIHKLLTPVKGQRWQLEPVKE